MQSRTLAFTLLTLALGACSSTSPDGDVSDAKLAARAQFERAMRNETAGDAVASPSNAADTPGLVGGTRPSSDVCRQRGWYGDGECDAWCPQGDREDCAAGGDVACAEFFSPADGFCNHKDPCGPVQDEDCQKQIDPGGGCAPDRPVAPRPVPGDGKCEPQSSAEFKADPDCANIVCPAVFSPADGVCNAKSACDYVIDEDCARESGNGSGGVVCDARAYPTNGVCEAPPGCEANDPRDCRAPVACIDIAYATNGKCEAAPGCEANDPVDCKAQVACITILYPTNGKCEAAAGCESSDPVDCKEPVACLAILYAKNGKCEAAPGCEASDPDC